MNKEMLETFTYWVEERDKIHTKKELLGYDRELWTMDPILKNNSFCNVRREDDRGTRDNVELIRKYWQNYYYPMWATLARYLNRREALEILSKHIDENGCEPNLPELERKLIELRESGVKVFSSAYMAFVQGQKGDRIKLIFSHLLTPIMEDMGGIHSKLSNSNTNLQAFNSMNYKYLGPFLRQQVLIDIAHTPLMKHLDYVDEFTVMGPGSERGMTKLYGDTKDFLGRINELREIIRSELDMELSAHDIQNCLCEFDKYTRVQEDPARKLKKYKVSK